MKHIQLPRHTLVGKEVLEKITDITSDFDSPLVISGEKTKEIAGNKITKELDCDSIVANGSEQIEKTIKENKIDIAIAVGGGRIIDFVKLAANNSKIEYISVPTNCAHDGIASPVASIGKGISKKVSSPWAIVVDIDIIKNAPYKYIAAGVGDIIAKYTAVRDWRLGHIIKGEYYGDYASSLSEMVSSVVMDNVQEIRQKTDVGLGVLVEALISSGAAMGIAGSSRPASGSEHKFSHALDLIAPKPALHGEQVGIGTIIMSYLHGENWKKIKNVLELAGCPTTAKQIGMDRDIFLSALLKAKEIRPDRYTIIEHIKLDKDIAENALDSTGVI